MTRRTLLLATLSTGLFTALFTVMAVAAAAVAAGEPMTHAQLHRALLDLKPDQPLILPAQPIRSNGGHVLRGANFARVESDGTTRIDWRPDRKGSPWLTIKGGVRTRLSDLRIEYPLYGHAPRAVIRIENLGTLPATRLHFADLWLRPPDAPGDSPQTWHPIRGPDGKLIAGLPQFGIDVAPDRHDNDQHLFERVSVWHAETAVRLAHWNGHFNTFRNCETSYCVNAFANVGGGAHNPAGAFRAEQHQGHWVETVVNFSSPPAANGIQVLGGNFEHCSMLFRLGAGPAWLDSSIDAKFVNVRFDGNDPAVKGSVAAAKKVIGICWFGKGLVLEEITRCAGAIILVADPAAVTVRNCAAEIRPIPAVHLPDGSVRWWDPELDNVPRDGPIPANWDFDWIAKRKADR